MFILRGEIFLFKYFFFIIYLYIFQKSNIDNVCVLSSQVGCRKYDYFLNKLKLNRLKSCTCVRKRFKLLIIENF